LGTLAHALRPIPGPSPAVVKVRAGRSKRALFLRLVAEKEFVRSLELATCSPKDKIVKYLSREVAGTEVLICMNHASVMHDGRRHTKILGLYEIFRSRADGETA